MSEAAEINSSFVATALPTGADAATAFRFRRFDDDIGPEEDAAADANAVGLPECAKDPKAWPTKTPKLPPPAPEERTAPAPWATLASRSRAFLAFCKALIPEVGSGLSIGSVFWSSGRMYPSTSFRFGKSVKLTTDKGACALAGCSANETPALTAELTRNHSPPTWMASPRLIWEHGSTSVPTKKMSRIGCFSFLGLLLFASPASLVGSAPSAESFFSPVSSTVDAILD
mmetsp:Transcript_34659/g.72131  ORF Transcript_34659/g.72131 Transcript_34659/m.72131 type:complete len:229 (-) Transcript_34659:661-1347(-)